MVQNPKASSLAQPIEVRPIFEFDAMGAAIAPPDWNPLDGNPDCHDKYLVQGQAIPTNRSFGLAFLSYEDAPGRRAALEFANRSGIALEAATPWAEFIGPKRGYAMALDVEELSTQWQVAWPYGPIRRDDDGPFFAISRGDMRAHARPLFDIGSVVGMPLTMMDCPETVRAAFIDREALLELMWCNCGYRGRRRYFSFRPQ